MTSKEPQEREQGRVAETSDRTRCAGCGIKLQTEDASRLGYVPAKSLDKDPVICQRCFRIKHYNDLSGATLNQDDFLKILGGIAGTNSLVVHIVDLFDFEGSLIAGLQRFIGNNPVLLVVNKTDLLPKAVNSNRILNWVQKQAKEFGLKTVDIALVSAKKNIGFDQLLTRMDQYRKGRDVYVVGATNVGKSTLINRLIRDYSDLEAELTTSPYPGTTLDLVRIPLDDGKAIIDTPGIVYRHRLTELVNKRELPTILPNSVLKPMIYQLNEEQTLFFGALARMDFVRGARQSFTCYVSEALKLHRTKLERADELYAEHKGELLAPPALEHLEELPPLVKHPIRIPRGGKTDVLISGLGWIAVGGESGAELVVWAPKGVKVAVRPALL
ncbi:ribosome biogenesis GTPase YqeH [Gorillibacterium sp. sgz500922]|uniref:ribosome biogenesis GTPase YqeH n=1 Tax=Gorillibacterium sp. sgz500922 TaxID=3446694 RepID=UPI003F681C56